MGWRRGSKRWDPRHTGLRRYALLLCVLVGLVALLTSLHLPSREQNEHGGDSGPAAGLAIRPAAITGSERPYFRYSIITGGAYEQPELERAAATDPVVADHYRDFRMGKVRPFELRTERHAYVSYRIGRQVYWTSHKVALRAGETLLGDGEHVARARCGNRVEDQPQQPVASPSIEPADWEFDAPPAAAPPAGSDSRLTYDIFAPPASFSPPLLPDLTLPSEIAWASGGPGAGGCCGFVSSNAGAPPMVSPKSWPEPIATLWTPIQQAQLNPQGFAPLFWSPTGGGWPVMPPVTVGGTGGTGGGEWRGIPWPILAGITVWNNGGTGGSTPPTKPPETIIVPVLTVTTFDGGGDNGGSGGGNGGDTPPTDTDSVPEPRLFVPLLLALAFGLWRVARHPRRAPTRP